ncbi:MAG TPA: zf-HC2 domain-containing protein, partial [Candidatus Binatia bacterium]
MKCKEVEELVTALVDDELSVPERAAIEAHLKGCSNCERLYRQESALKSELRRAAADLKAPSTLREKILNDRRVFPRQPDFENRRAWGLNVFFRPAFAVALLVLVALPALYLMWPAAKPLSLGALEVHEKIIGGELSFIRSGSPAEIKETLYRSVGGAFEPMTYNLSAMKLKAVGGTVREFDGRKVLVTIY